jgi:hypothetical protein
VTALREVDGCHTITSVQDRRQSRRHVEERDRDKPIPKLLTNKQVLGERTDSRAEPATKEPRDISFCINGYGPTMNVLEPELADKTQPPDKLQVVLGCCLRLRNRSPSCRPYPTEASCPPSRWRDRGLIRIRSPTFIGIRINSAMQVTDVSDIRRTIIPASEHRKVSG